MLRSFIYILQTRKWAQKNKFRMRILKLLMLKPLLLFNIIPMSFNLINDSGTTLRFEIIKLIFINREYPVNGLYFVSQSENCGKGIRMEGTCWWIETSGLYLALEGIITLLFTPVVSLSDLSSGAAVFYPGAGHQHQYKLRHHSCKYQKLRATCSGELCVQMAQ